MIKGRITPVIPRIAGLTRVKTNSRHRMPGSEVADPETWEAMCRDAAAYRLPHKVRGGKTAEYTLRKDAVIGYAIIFDMPYGCAGWDDSDYEYFLEMSLSALRLVSDKVPRERAMRIFRDENIRKYVYPHRYAHPDEMERRLLSKTLSIIGDARDEDGRYCGSIIDFNLRTALEAQFRMKFDELLDCVDKIDMERQENIVRSACSFPDGWDQMYMDWKSGKLSSVDFMKQSGLKMATFYNKVTDYRCLLRSEQDKGAEGARGI